jgi:hypothetical protein
MTRILEQEQLGTGTAPSDFFFVGMSNTTEYFLTNHHDGVKDDCGKLI